MKRETCIILDAGHGGLEPGTDRYTTAPAKMHRHGESGMHCDGWFYEGVSNRRFADSLANMFLQLGIPCYKVHHPWEDTDLSDRVLRANAIAAFFDYPVYLSLHSNASPGHDAQGYEIYTTPGETQSDLLAECIFNATKVAFRNTIRYRTDQRDGDQDKEAAFAVIRGANMAAVLIEYLFFDNLQDAEKLLDSETRGKFVHATVAGTLNYLKNITG